jgi:tight adherence protein C
MDFFYALIKPEFLITLLVGFAAFGTVLTLAMPLFASDKMAGRIKGVTVERDKLRANQKALLAGSDIRLREKPKAGLMLQLVDALSLRKVFEAEASRELLRQAGLRSERHLVTFLALRGIVPIVTGILVFVYSSTVFADRVSPSMRVAATMIGLIVGFYLPMLFLKNKRTKRQKSIKRAWSDALDLTLICVESGMAVEPSLARVAREIGSGSVPLAEELTLTVAELSYLSDRRKAFENLAKRTGLESVKSVVTSLIQAERYGTPVGTALRVLAQENRDSRMQEAEKKAAALPPKLTVPMILFFLPVIFVVILGPSIILVTSAK